MRLAVVLMALSLCVPAAADERERAQELYRRGMIHYEIGEFDDAIRDFKEAYALSRAPGLLFNLAQAARLGQKPEQALHFYKAYLRERPDAPNRADVEARIAALEAPQPVTVVAPPPSLTASPERNRTMLWAGVGTALGGAGLLGAGIGLGVESANVSSRLTAAAHAGGTWSPASQALYLEGQRESSAAIALYAIGGAAVVTGTLVAILGSLRRGHLTRTANR